MGHPVLRTRAREIEPPEIKSIAVQKLIDDMLETMREYHGIGLAAPQVHEGLRVFVAGSDGEDADLPLVVMINPEVTPIATTIVEDWEGCLSIPDVRGRVPRALDVSVRALDRRGRTFETTLHGFAARVVQHETDHLDGVLFVDRMRSLESLTFLEEFARYWAETPKD